MYCLFDTRINSFYTTSGSWIPIGSAKNNLSKLCVFADVGTARLCAKNSGLGFKTASVLNEKSIKKKLKLKSLDMLKPNQGIFGEIDSEEEKVSEKDLVDTSCEPVISNEPSKDPQHVGKSSCSPRRKRTYCELLDELDDERMYLRPDSSRKKSSLLIDQTMVVLNEFLGLMDQWTQRMSEVENTILSCDLKTTDELHFLEMFSNLSEEELASCSKRIQVIRHERRKAKDEKEIGKYFLSMCQAGVNPDKIRHLQQICDGMNTRTYRVKDPESFMSGEEDEFLL